MAGLMDLFIKIGVEDEASDKISGITSKIGSGLKTAAKVGTAAVGAVYAGAAALTGALVSGATQVAAYGDNVDKMSQKMGMSAQSYQEWDAILQHSGTSIESMQRGMMTLSQAAESNSDAFGKLGISQEQVASMSQEELFAATIEGLQGMEEGSERAVLAQQLLGGAAKELGPLLNTSAEETEAMRQRVHELGGVMSDEAVKASAKFQDSLQDMRTSFTGLKNGLVAGFMPSLSTVMDGITELFSGNSEAGIEMITEGINAFADQINEVVPRLIEAATQILGPIVNAISQNLPQIISTLLPVIISAAGQLIVALATALPDIFTAVWEALKAIGAELWPHLEDAFSGIASWFSAKFGEAWEAIKGVFSGVGDFFKGIWDNIKDTFSELGTKLSDAIGGAVTAGVNKVIEWTENTINGAIRLINTAIEFINKIPGVNIGTISELSFGRFAIGMDYVPYDDFPAYLHKGEAVLTASEADEWRRGKSGDKSVQNSFNFYGVSQSDLDYIVAYVNRGLA